VTVDVGGGHFTLSSSPKGTERLSPYSVYCTPYPPAPLGVESEERVEGSINR
jgi:hypothetical protein